MLPLMRKGVLDDFDPMKKLIIVSMAASLFLSPASMLAEEVVVGEDTGSADANRAALQASIEAKNKELQKIKEEMEQAKRNLDATTSQRKTLQTELRSIDGSIAALELDVRAAQVESQKLGLEIASLSSGIETINAMIETKLAALPKIVRAYHEESERNPLFSLLERNTISDVLADTASLDSIQAEMLTTLNESRVLKVELAKRQEDVSGKRVQIDAKKQEIVVTTAIARGEEERKRALLTETKNKEQLYQKNFDELAKKAMEFENEIERIESALRKNVDLSQLPSPRPGLLQNPVPAGRLTQGYGRTQFAIRNYKSQWHNGIDLGAPVGTPVYAAEAGEVIALGNTDAFCPRGAYGKYVVIKHANNLTTFYSHFSAFAVKKGQTVKRGELIGYVGNTGWSTGPHVQVTVYASNTYTITQSKSCGLLPVGGDLNPLDYISL